MIQMIFLQVFFQDTSPVMLLMLNQMEHLLRGGSVIRQVLFFQIRLLVLLLLVQVEHSIIMVFLALMLLLLEQQLILSLFVGSLPRN